MTSRSLDRRFEAAVFDWDGTAVVDRSADARRVRHLVEALCANGFDVAIVSGTHVDNVDRQLSARPAGPGRLYLCLNRGSEVYMVEPEGPVLLYRRSATAAEVDALTAAAENTVARLADRGLQAKLVAERLNRRKIDLIPEPIWADPPKARIAELLQAVEERLHASGFNGLNEVATLAETSAAEAGLGDPRVTSDVKHVEIGLTDKSDSAHWVLSELGRRGIGAHAVLLAGDEFASIGGLPGSDSLMLVLEAQPATKVTVGVEPGSVPQDVIVLGGGPDAFVTVLEDQLVRRVRGEIPRVDPDPAWTLGVDGFDSTREHVRSALLSVADGSIGTSGSPMFARSATGPRVFVGGLYDGTGSQSRLLEAPVWSQIAGEVGQGTHLRRVLELRTGLLFEEQTLADGKQLRSVRFSSAARPGTVVLRLVAPEFDHGPALAPARDAAHQLVGRDGRRTWMSVSATQGGVTAAACDSVRSHERDRRVDRVGVYIVGSDGVPPVERAVGELTRLEQEADFERLLYEQRAIWAERWECADVRIEGDPELQSAVRLSLFHVMASVARDGEAAVGARGLTGAGYRGHVFWDADIFVLPFLAATQPEAARAMLEYRVRRLPAAFENARASGRGGARFPWESARTGHDVTPSEMHLDGKTERILTGELEEHIVADVAWSVACYLDWTADEEFRLGPGLTVLVETARYWASRIRVDPEGRGHIEGVIGPDEYHEDVDDNAYTNVMARWNLRKAAEAVKAAPGTVVEKVERARWLALADALVDGYDAGSGIYEQFAGFSQLEPLVIGDIAPRRPVAAELLLGTERLRRAQVVKQADVLMLHHLVPNEVAPGSLRPNLLYYEPRTAHGSSLSPGVHASLFARLGMTAEALEWLRLTSRIDLDDLTETTADGLHIGAMGSLWQALAFGFAGLRPERDSLRLDPRLPDAWSALEVNVRFRGAQVRVRLENAALEVSSDRPVRVAVPGRTTPLLVRASGLRLARRDGRWGVTR